MKHTAIISCPSCQKKNRVPMGKFGGGKCGSCSAALSYPNHPVAIEGVDALKDLVTNSDKPILVDFWAPWCGPCRMVAPEMEKIAKNKSGDWIVAKINTQDHPKASLEYGISGIPTFVVFNGGKEVGRESGARPAAAIEAVVKGFI